MAKKSPTINGGSMSDISFLLLTFFLLTSSINTDLGIARKLPPPLPPDAPKPEIHDRNVFKVAVNFRDELQVQGKLADIADLRDMAKEFLANPNNNPKMSEKKMEDIAGLGPVAVSKGVVSLRNDRGTSYEMYVRVQNELTAAFHELRDELSQERFGIRFNDLTKDADIEAIQKAIPLTISEAEPTAVGTTK
ncbi:MAG: biopolymer transporter ExbD [Bacteroidales bacterium]|nr:biopolymer transporter ExbD [Bacteroidales bacterium]MDE5609464.1 biopolymer transporter ExbD [Bacteroidales bacterium]MDE6630283.1 biopolymer transporter ExbD [Bacteroidales bacterium]MDE6694352.1 biopolymer transporter ExbD [Bacteroidales bacterium]